MRKLISLLILVGVIGIIGTGCSKEVEDIQSENTNTEKNTNQEEVQKPKDRIEIFGSVEAAEKKIVSLQFPVKIKNIILEEGQQVDLNDSIMELDFLGQYENYKNIESKIKAIKEQILKQQTINNNLTNLIGIKQNGLTNKTLPEIQAKQLSYDIASKTYEEAKIDLDESKKLYQAGVMSQKNLDIEKQNLFNLEKKLLIEKSGLDLCISAIESELSELKIELIQNEKALMDLEQVQLMQAKNEFNNLKNQLMNNEDLKDLYIVSGFKEGLIEKVYCEEGQVIDGGSPIVSIIDKSSIYIKGEVPEELVGFVKEGKAVNVIPISDETKNYKGIVDKVSKIATNKNNEVIVMIDIRLDRVDQYLKLNYNVNIEIEK